MPTVKYSVSAYIADGTTTDYLITWDYLDDDHITVEIDGLSNADPTASHTFTKLNDTTVRVTDGIGGAIAAGKEIQIRRNTPITTRPISFSDGSALLAADLNKNSDYLLYSMQEALDQVDFTVQFQQEAEAFRDETEALRDTTQALRTEVGNDTADADAHRIAAALSETNAATSEANSSTSEDNAAASELAAQTSETGAAASAAAALVSENAAAASEAASAASEAASAVSEANAAGSEAGVAADAATATSKAAAAGVSEANALIYKNNAAASASNSEISAVNSDNSADASANSAVQASNSENAAATSRNTASTYATNSQASAVASEASKVASGLSEAAAATSEANASSSEVNAAASEANAATSEGNAATSEANSATSATASETSRVASVAAQVAAETAETNADTSEANAAASESSASTSASNASTSETNAAASEGVATTQAGISTTKAAESAASAAAALASENAAATSEANSATSEGNAATSATASETSRVASVAAQVASETAKTASQTAQTASEAARDAASASEAAAATSEANAAASEASASTDAATATTKAGEASTSASNAASSAASAQASKDAALEALDSFDDRYLGQKAADPTLDNDGNALVAGALYFNTTDDAMKVYEGSVWVAAYASLSGALIASSNLSDLTDTATSRTNLGLVIGTNVQAFSAILQNTTASYTTAEESKLAGIEANANRTLNNNQLTNGSGYITVSEVPVVDATAIIKGDSSVTVSDNGSDGKVVVRVDNVDVAEFNDTHLTIPKGTTAQRDVNAGSGTIRFNTTTGFLEAKTNTGWGSLATPPSITGISPDNFNGEAGNSFTVTGTFFDQNSTAVFRGVNGTEYAAGSVTYVSSNELTVTNAANLPVSNEPFRIKVINGAGLSGESSVSIDAGSVPSFTVAAGNVATTTQWNNPVSVTVQATDAENTISGYSIVEGNLPSGLTLNSTTGAITGTSVAQATTTYIFTVEATDSAGNTNTRQFNIQIVNAPPLWSSPSEGATISSAPNTAVNIPLSASDPEGASVSFASTGLPQGLSISGSSIVGQSPNPGSNNVSVTASDGFASAVRNFYINMIAPYDQTFYNTDGFSRTGSIQYATLAAGSYRIELFGAQPPAQTYQSPSYDGGRPAFLLGQFTLSSITDLKLLVGQAPPRSGFNGGAGGSFVATTADVPIIVAGGGGSHRVGDCGGKYGSNGGNDAQKDASFPTSLGQSNGKSNSSYAGGTSGNAGGDTHAAEGGAGAGFYTDASAPYHTSEVNQAEAFVNGGTGGQYVQSGDQSGGFGGGGSGGWGGSGGGGGYNGGAAGLNCTTNVGGGGGSFITSAYGASLISSSLYTAQAGSGGHHGQIRIYNTF